MTEGIDWLRDKNGHIYHPVTKRAFESRVPMWHFCDDRGLMEEMAIAICSKWFSVSNGGAKIAGPLDSLAYDEGDSRDGGFVVAALKTGTQLFARQHGGG